jgi:hypothetical protein
MKRIITTLVAVAIASPAVAADMPSRHRHVAALSPNIDALASQMAHYRAIAVACRASDGTNLSRAFWDTRLTAVPTSQKSLFANTVKARSNAEAAALSGPDSALKCDDALDVVEDQFPSVAEAGAQSTPLCWSDVTDTNSCDGTGDDDILAGVDALLEGY